MNKRRADLKYTIDLDKINNDWLNPYNSNHISRSIDINKLHSNLTKLKFPMVRKRS